jgi:hypothetical protein
VGHSTMRVYGPSGSTLAARPAGARRAAGGAFSLSEQESSPNSAGPGGVRSISSLDALIALQGIEDATERKKRSVARGRNALDLLEKLKLSLLDGTIEPATLGRLKSAAEGLTAGSGDPGLDNILAEIDLRIAVELAKAGVS